MMQNNNNNSSPPQSLGISALVALGTRLLKMFFRDIRNLMVKKSTIKSMQKANSLENLKKRS